MSIYAKLLAVQEELKAPKDKNNDFGKYRYRSFEQQCEAVKPLLVKNNLTLIVKDNIEVMAERFYVKAIATLVDIESGETIETVAYAREEESKKGMDASQVTGACSSYARKYALNGLFLIDDTKDADTNAYQEAIRKAEEQEQKEAEAKAKEANKPATKAMKDSITKLAEEKGKPLAKANVDQMTVGQYTTWMAKLKEM